MILVPSWQRARDQSCSAMLAGEMCVVVTGPPGTGKTLLIDTVARALRSTGWTVVTTIARLPSNEEFAALTGSAAILIDDADRLTATELRTLNRLRQCSVLLTGAMGLEKRCPADSRVTLAPLPFGEVKAYVGLWLKQSGLDPDLMDEATTRRLAEVSSGIPRALRTLLAGALKSARSEGSDNIQERHIDNAAWQQAEYTAARRLKQGNTAPGPVQTSVAEATTGSRQREPAPSRPDTVLETRLSQAPFAEVKSDGATNLSRNLGLAGLAIAVSVVLGYWTRDHWLQRLTDARALIVAMRDDSARSISISIPVEPVPVVALAEPTMDRPSSPDSGDVLPADIIPALPPAVTPASPVPLSVAVVAVPPPSTPVAQADRLSPELIRLLIQRGQQMFELDDYPAARLLFGRAAESGSASGMLALGRSYDPTLNVNRAPKPGADPAQAAYWYGKATVLGNSDALILLQQLERSARE